MTTKQTRREFLANAARAATGLVVTGLVRPEPAAVEDIQAVPLGVDDTQGQPGPGGRTIYGIDGVITFWGMPPVHISDYGCSSPRIRPTITL